ncbi:hypothetical protein K1719_012182 [Acacia pycnantha]|nr:hypothetical protein K1719_012182 [Acacia pycnantha]
MELRKAAGDYEEEEGGGVEGRVEGAADFGLFHELQSAPATFSALQLEANLGAATFLGFDKDWIESVWAKFFGIHKSNVLVAEEKISVMEEELEKCDIAFQLMQKKRMEAREKLAIVQNEFKAILSLRKQQVLRICPLAFKCSHFGNMRYLI